LKKQEPPKNHRSTKGSREGSKGLDLRTIRSRATVIERDTRRETEVRDSRRES